MGEDISPVGVEGIAVTNSNKKGDIAGEVEGVCLGGPERESTLDPEMPEELLQQTPSRWWG
jgi:hypothetical protein